MSGSLCLSMSRMLMSIWHQIQGDAAFNELKACPLDKSALAEVFWP